MHQEVVFPAGFLSALTGPGSHLVNTHIAVRLPLASDRTHAQSQAAGRRQNKRTLSRMSGHEQRSFLNRLSDMNTHEYDVYELHANEYSYQISETLPISDSFSVNAELMLHSVYFLHSAARLEGFSRTHITDVALACPRLTR